MDTASLSAPRISGASAAVVAAAYGALVLGVLVPLYLLVVGPSLQSGAMPADWTPLRMLMALAGATLLLGFLGFFLYQRFATIVSESGISVPTLRGREDIAWADIDRVAVRGHDLVLLSSRRKVIVNSACYPNPDKLVSYINTRLAGARAGRSGQL